ncbi:MAG: exosortase K [Bacteroidota bacterium]
MKIKSYLFYGIIFSLTIIGKIAYAQATNDALVFILKPLSSIISFLTNSPFIYLSDSGFYFESLNITIDKSCSGVNFWIISFVVFSFSFVKVTRSNFQRLLSIPVLLLATFAFTLFANTSRILISILISRQTAFDYPWLHQAQGVFIYLSLLVIAYTIINHLSFKFNNYHEELT